MPRKTSSLVSPRSDKQYSSSLTLSTVRLEDGHVALHIFFLITVHSDFTDLIQDWASDSAPDIYSFVPYSWTFKVLFHQFEMIWAANQHNWIDCSTKQQENGKEEEEAPPDEDTYRCNL